MPQSDGTIQPDVQSVVQNHKTPNKTIVLAFPLKVGGTFLRTALIHLLAKNYAAFLSRGSYASTDQSRDLYFPSVLNVHVTATQKPTAAIAHCHMYATLPVTSIIETFDIPIVVNTRNIFDTLFSYFEMLEKDKDVGKVATDDFVLQTYTGYHQLSAEDRRWHLVNVAPVWYSRFYAYWIRYTEKCEQQGIREPFWTTFNGLKDNGVALLSEIAKHVDPQNTYSPEEAEVAFTKAVSNKEQLRFNKGVSGRGVAFFNDDEKATIRKLMAGSDSIYQGQLEKLGVL